MNLKKVNNFQYHIFNLKKVNNFYYHILNLKKVNNYKTTLKSCIIDIPEIVMNADKQEHLVKMMKVISDNLEKVFIVMREGVVLVRVTDFHIFTRSPIYHKFCLNSHR